MRISFDLDSTLIPNGNEFKIEKLNRIAKKFGVEELRIGTRELFENLKKEGHEISIYTTSFRTKYKIRLTLYYYGIKVRRIVNQTENEKVLKKLRVNSSKYPPAFNFDLHIDDLKGVGIESERLNFKSIIVNPNDENWIDTIEKGIKELNYNRKSPADNNA